MNFWIALLTIIIAAMVITGLCVLLMWLEKKRPSKRFDERQERIRGKAANWALLVGMVYFCGIAIASILLHDEMRECWFAVVLTGIALELLVYYVYCIVNDAHIPLLKSPKQRIFWGYLCSITQFAAAATRVGANNLYFTETGEVAKRAFHETPLDAVAFTQLICGVLFVLLATMEMIRLLRRKED